MDQSIRPRDPDRLEELAARSLEELVADVECIQRGTLTIAIVTLTNGHMEVGTSRPLPGTKYCENAGRLMARENAMRGLMRIYAFLQHERLAGGAA